MKIIFKKEPNQLQNLKKELKLNNQNGQLKLKFADIRLIYSTNSLGTIWPNSRQYGSVLYSFSCMNHAKYCAQDI